MRRYCPKCHRILSSRIFEEDVFVCTNKFCENYRKEMKGNV
jgi:uncharacterized radical SAM superfamily Fe-S cluster-containing enzyme